MRPASGLATACALVALAAFSGFQAIQLRSQSRPQALTAFLLRPGSRGEVTAIGTRNIGPFVLLEADLPGASGELLWDLRQASGSQIEEGRASSGPSGSS